LTSRWIPVIFGSSHLSCGGPAVSVSGFLTFKAEELGYHPEVSWRWRPARPQDQRRDGQVRGREHGQGDDPRRAKRTRKTIKGPPIFLGVWPEFDFRPADVLDCHLEREFMGRARRTPPSARCDPGRKIRPVRPGMEPGDPGRSRPSGNPSFKGFQGSESALQNPWGKIWRPTGSFVRISPGPRPFPGRF